MRTTLALTLVLSVVILATSHPAYALPVTGAVVWFDASDVDGDGIAGNNPTDGTGISTWVDKASAVQGVQSATQGSGPLQPSYLNNFQNSMPVLNFSSDRLVTSSVSMGTFTYFLAFQSDLSSTRIIYERSSNSNSNDGEYLTSGSGATASVRRSTLTQRLDASNWATSGTLITATHRFGGTHATHELFVDGTLLTPASGATTDPGTGVVADVIHIGARSGDAIPFDGRMAEMIAYPSALGNAATNIVNNYLSAKYDTSMTVAADNYEGDENGNGDYDFDVFGIGQLDDLAYSSGTSAGFGIEAISGLDNDDFMLAGHKITSNTQLDDRWDRTWYLDNSLDGNESITLTFDWSDAGLGTADPDFLDLVYSSTDGGPFGFVSSGLLSGDTVTFSLSAAALGNGYYTLGFIPVPEPSSFLLLGLGALGMVRHTRRRRRNVNTSVSNSSINPRSEAMKKHEFNSQTWTRTLVAMVMLVTILFVNHSAHAGLIGSSASNPAISAKQILDYGASLGDGVYWIDPDGSGGNAPFQAYADMTTDGGGWTLMTFAGTIPTTKTALAGANNWFPVFNNFGTYDPNALTSGNAFSHRDMVDSLFQDSSQILSYRASNLDNQMIFPVADRTSWLGGILPNISYLTLTNDGSTYVTHPGSELAVFNQGTLPRYTGYDWNIIGNNSDGFGSYATALNHRSLLYWENLDNATYDQQWFHASPLTLAPSTGPVNDFQDIAFLLREDVTYTPPVPEPSSLLLLGFGVLGLVRHARRRRRRA